MQRLIKLARICLFVVSILVTRAQGQSAGVSALPEGMTFTCRFSSGPRAGQIKDFTRVPSAIPMQVGSSCTDGGSSSGIAIAQLTTAPKTRVNVSDAAARPAQLTLMCRFSSGPRAGQTQALAEVPGATPLYVGGVCSDGASSTGTAIALTTASGVTNSWSGATGSDLKIARRETSTICQFMSGPKAHGWHDYAPLQPLAIGSSCQDGLGSVGIVVTSGHGEQY